MVLLCDSPKWHCCHLFNVHMRLRGTRGTEGLRNCPKPSRECGILIQTIYMGCGAQATTPTEKHGW